MRDTKTLGNGLEIGPLHRAAIDPCDGAYAVRWRHAPHNGIHDMELWNWVMLVLALPVQFLFRWQFLKHAPRACRSGS